MRQQLGQRRLLLAVIGFLAFALVSYTFIAAGSWIRHPFPGFFVYENMTVGPYSLPDWTGGVAGLKPLDRVTALDGQPLPARRALYDRVKRAPIGTTFRYRVVREGRALELSVPSMMLSFHQWFLSFGLFVVVGAAFLIIGAVPYQYRAPSPAALPLYAMGVAVFAWFGTIFDCVTAGALPIELRFFALALTPGAALHMGLIMTKGTGVWRLYPISLSLNYGAALAVGALTSVAFFGSLENWIYVFRLGYLYLCGAAVVFLIILGVALRRSPSDLARSRLRVMLVGAGLGFFLPTFCAVLTSSFRWPIPYNLALVPTVFFPLSVAYALLKYNLFDLGHAFKLALSRIALTAFLLAIYVVVALLIGPWAGIYDNDPLVALLFSVLIVLLFNPLLRRIEAAVDRYIYRQDYDAPRVQDELSAFLRSLSAARALAEGFLERLTERVGIDHAALAYRPEGAQHYITVGCKCSIRAIEVIADTALRLCRNAPDTPYHAISRSEVSTNPAFRMIRPDLLEIFDRLRADILVPVAFEREARGMIFFGKKSSGAEYSADDLRLLGTLTEQLALSLENGRLYEESEQARRKYEELYREAEVAKQRLVESERWKKEFVANICHELRTPISSIVGYTEVLADPGFRGDPRFFLDRLVSSGEAVSRVMDNLLNFSRIEVGGFLTQLETVKVKEILGALELMSRRIIRSRPIDFRVSIAPGIDTLRTDPKKLQQILTNLLTNAVKFTHRGSIDLKANLKTGGGGTIEIAVADTGIGIKEEDQEVIFEDFRQLDGSSTRQYGGTGVGLGVCRKLAESLGGRIEVESKVGIGSVFTLLLPMNRDFERAEHRIAATAVV